MSGYYRDPAVRGENVVFASEDDLWGVSASGGEARRLTSNPGRASAPALSPDGSLLAFSGRDEGGDEVYVMPASGGEARRVTFLGAATRVVGFTPNGESIVFASDSSHPFAGRFHLFTVPSGGAEGGEPERLPFGPAVSVSWGEGGGVVIGRNTTDIARWKRYRGGQSGELWVDPEANGEWRRLVETGGNVASPLWFGDRIFFVSDHEGTGNLYSTTPEGADLRRHTDHEDFYVRHPATDGNRIVYHAGADLYLFDPEGGETLPIPVEYPSPKAQRKRRFVEASNYLQGFAPHPEGHSLALTTRGRVFTMGNKEGAPTPHGEAPSVRHRLPVWLYDGERVALVSDASGEDAVEVHTPPKGGDLTPPERLEGLDLGRPASLVASPKNDEVALTNHRNEVVMVDLSARSARVLDASVHGRVQGLSFSPDGRWLAYGLPGTQKTTAIRLCELESGEVHTITEPVLWDGEPSFDPEGKYLYFLTRRDFDPVYDDLHFDLGFPKGARPALLTLRSDEPSPFSPEVPGEEDRSGNSEGPGDGEDEPLRIDLEDIERRVALFPVPVGKYERVRGLRGGKVLFSSRPAEGALAADPFAVGPRAKSRLEVYNFEEREAETLVEGITSFEVSADAKTLLYRSGNKLRAIPAGEKPKPEEPGKPPRKSGWVDLKRVKVSIEPPGEWRQMFGEVWRLQRDNFWSEDLSGVDWSGVYRRYLPLLERVSTRSEFSDLAWEMQGELSTSHAYEIGGDYRPEPSYRQGFLGADVEYDPETESYYLSRIVSGDSWDGASGSPLARPGANVHEGDRLLAVDGRTVDRETPPAALLVGRAADEVLLTIERADGERRDLTVKTLAVERPARYREWVEANRREVHEATDGRIGYLHIPDMMPRGYAEFHRGLLAESGREGLVVDARFNGGGHVSQLVLEKLARGVIGYEVPRHRKPDTYPELAVAGPLVALTNERAGSDGDIFSHAFKLMGLGPLIGKRTWGGVIGIEPTDSLIDGSIATQPEYSHWFSDVGFGVENYGTDPTIEVEIPPHEHASGEDPQLERAISESLRLLEEDPPKTPDLETRPNLSPPRLPERG